MADSDPEGRRFQVPQEIVGELYAAGYVRSATNGVTRGADVGELVLVVFNTAASTITLLETPGVIRALAESLAKWFRREERSHSFELTAHGPHGYVDFRSDAAPDPDELTDFLRRNIWGDQAPSDSAEPE
jgi:hypothetical protein